MTTSNFDPATYASYFKEPNGTLTGCTDDIERLRPKSPPPKDKGGRGGPRGGRGGQRGGQHLKHCITFLRCVKKLQLTSYKTFCSLIQLLNPEDVISCLHEP